METKLLTYDTSRRKIVDLTQDARSFCNGRGDGLLNLFAPHSTVGLVIMELGSQSDVDLEAALRRLLPRDDRYAHKHGATGHGADHLVPAFLAPSLTLPVEDGRVLLGTWQSIVLVDLNVDNPERQVRLSFVAG
jgi:secondary thiamine-phosphate synthase enzyme